MVKSFAEVGDILADHENRIASLEASQLYADVIPTIRERLDTLESHLYETQPEWTHKQWNEIVQIKGMILHLQNKVEELLKTKSKKRDKL